MVTVLVWHQTDPTGVWALSNVAIVAPVTVVSTTLTYPLFRALDPH